MKQTLLTLFSVFLVALCPAEAQSTPMTVERIYEKYGERDNIVTMNIPGEMLSEKGTEVTNITQFIMIVRLRLPILPRMSMLSSKMASFNR